MIVERTNNAWTWIVNRIIACSNGDGQIGLCVRYIGKSDTARIGLSHGDSAHPNARTNGTEYRIDLPSCPKTEGTGDPPARPLPGLAASAPGIAALLGGLVFPIGLTMIIFSGTDLLTSNMLYTSLPFLTHPARRNKLRAMSVVLSVCGLCVSKGVRA